MGGFFLLFGAFCLKNTPFAKLIGSRCCKFAAFGCKFEAY